jgi:hypothetical protein
MEDIYKRLTQMVADYYCVGEIHVLGREFSNTPSSCAKVSLNL